MAKMRWTSSILAACDGRSSPQFVSRDDVLDLVAKVLRRACVRLLASRRRQGSTTNATVLDCLAQAQGSEARTNATANEPARRRLPLGTINGPLMVVFGSRAVMAYCLVDFSGAPSGSELKPLSRFRQHLLFSQCPAALSTMSASFSREKIDIRPLLLDLT